MEKEKTQNEHAMESLHRKQRAAQRNRFVITTVVLGTFILLLVLGAFLGSYSRIIDFWFNANDEDGVPGWSEPTSGPSAPNYCDNCGDKIEYNNKKESSGDDW